MFARSTVPVSGLKKLVGQALGKDMVDFQAILRNYYSLILQFIWPIDNKKIMEDSSFSQHPQSKKLSFILDRQEMQMAHGRLGKT